MSISHTINLQTTWDFPSFYEQGANSDMRGGPAATQAMVKIFETSDTYPVFMHASSISAIDDVYKA